jgi:3-deoxy-D-manno-octulosonic-acid transferase
LFQREKYASGFRQRLGNYPEFNLDDRKVIWLHCVSVGETNAARPLVDKLIEDFPDHRLIISTITKTGQELAQKIFAEKADAIFYFPFDWKFTVRRALSHFNPSLVLLMETEIWPRFIYEAKQSGSKIAIVNGRLSERSAIRYSKVKGFITRVLSNVDLALMQAEHDSNQIVMLGIAEDRTHVCGNLKFETSMDDIDQLLVEDLRDRFDLKPFAFVIVAGSTHSPEEEWILAAFGEIADRYTETKFKLVLAPRHPERFEEVAKVCRDFCNENQLEFVRRSDDQMESDRNVAVVLLDSIGELSSIYKVADVVVVGGSMIPHGGQSVLEPAALGKPILVGPYTHNFSAVIGEFQRNNAIVQNPDTMNVATMSEWLATTIDRLYLGTRTRDELGKNAYAVMETNRGATERTVKKLAHLIR